MNKKELVKAISNEINFNQKDVENCIDTLSEIIIGLLPTCTCGGNNEIEWVQQYFSNRTRLFEIYSKFEGK